jgi:DNA-directed RNA polymerase specialized sigma24 family protein
MARYHDDFTEMGGERVAFQTTHWSEVIDARSSDHDKQAAVVSSLISRYWKPVYCYLRRKGCSNERAKDLTQGFFYEIALGRNLFAQAQKDKGKFRVFLLAALNHYQWDVYEKESAQKRKPQDTIATVDTEKMSDLLESQQASEPDEVFQYAWASEVLDQVLASVRDACYQKNQQSHWEIFYAKVVVPILEDTEPPSLNDLCARLGIRDEATASNMINSVKRQFQSAMRRYLRQFVSSDAEVDEEFRDIFEILSGNRSR